VEERDVDALHQAYMKTLDPEVRRAAARGLADLDDPRAVEALLDVLHYSWFRHPGDPREEPCMRAIRGLGRLGDPRALEPLLARYREALEYQLELPSLAPTIADALIDLGDEGVEALVAIHVHEDVALAVLDNRGQTEPAQRLREFIERRREAERQAGERGAELFRQEQERAAEAERAARRRIATLASSAEAAALLVELYDANPAGFLRDAPDAEFVQMVGARLNELGRFPSMLEAHRMFAAERPRMARNLEMVWDGIGTWAG
jgi:HEAT repeat protein